MADPIETHPDFANLQSWWANRVVEGKTILAQNGITALWWQYLLFGEGVVQDLVELDQAIKITLATRQGSDPHRPEFSSGIFNFIDYPIPRATPFVVRDSTAAIERWEPRVALEAISVEPYSGGFERILVGAEWTIVDTAIDGQTEVAVG